MTCDLHELAIRLLLLQENRPKPAFHWREKAFDLEAKQKQSELYKDHMHQEYLLEQAIYQRIGIENGNKIIDEARQTLNLMSPSS